MTQAPRAGRPEEGAPAVAREEGPPAVARDEGRAPAPAAGRPAPRRPGSARFLFGATMLVLEVFVVLFGALVVFGLKLVPTLPLVVASVVLAGLCVLATALLRRGEAGWIIGTVAQVLLIGSALVLPMMAIVGVIFAAMWVAAYIVGGRIDVERQERYRAEVELWAQDECVR